MQAVAAVDPRSTFLMATYPRQAALAMSANIVVIAM